MAKFVLVAFCVAVVAVVAEPPSSYFPPQARNAPSSRYGAPQDHHQHQQSGGFGGQRSSGRSFSYNSLAENQFGGSSSSRGRFSSSRQQPSSQFGPSSRSQQPSQQYGTPSYDDASSRFGNQGRQQPSQQYGAPFARQQQPSSSYSAPRQQQPSSSYSAPAPRQQQLSSSYTAPAPREQPQSQYGVPSSTYGVPFGRNKMQDDDLAEPANYEYNYEVQAAEESGAEFGHQETREDDRAQGEYHVLLPDGRMQIVEYEADEEGFRPRIRYEETGYPDARDSQQGPY